MAGRDETIGESYDVGGPDVLTYRQMIEEIARLRGRRRLIVEVPVLSPQLSSYWLHLVTPVRAGVARPLVEGLRNPTVMREERIRELIPFRLTTFAEAARAALSEQPRLGAADVDVPARDGLLEPRRRRALAVVLRVAAVRAHADQARLVGVAAVVDHLEPHVVAAHERVVRLLDPAADPRVPPAHLRGT